MEVILLEKIHRLGKLGDKVIVKSGYGRNYLVPQHKAVPATPQNIAKFEAERADLEKKQADSFGAATARGEVLFGAEVTIEAKAGAEGKLFGSVGTADISRAFSATGEAIEKSEIRLPQGPLRELGEHEVEIGLHADVKGMVLVRVVAEEG